MVKNNKGVADQNGHLGAANKIQSEVPKSTAIRKKQYKGVRMRSWGSWVSEIRAPNQKTRIWLGSYATPEAAARAYDAALLCLKGSTANLNFPITPSIHLPDTTLMSPKSIQRVAAAAANSTPPFSPPPPPPSSSPSPSLSMSSSSDSYDELFPSCSENYIECRAEESNRLMDPWLDFGDWLSPKYAVDQMFNACAPFAPPLMEECDDQEGDISLWSFC
ncbi:ethylene-responsive transcription factor ERF014-like [Tasmannia lanceolata]|uniref:ethylene-responsive transcription factor ERF014-like n=1 Tax=Tasmannia lanceolata TaxID=3420 RepID=UPI004063A995